MADAPTAKPSSGLTSRDQEIVVAAIRNAKGGVLEIEYDGMAAELGLKDRKSAIASWSSLKKKLFGSSLDKPASDASPKAKTPRKPATPKSSGKKSAKAVKEEDDEDADDAETGSATNAAAPDVEPAAGAGEMNEDVESPGTKDTPTTPKGKGTDVASATPSTGKKRGRKTKAEKEAEAAANGETPAGEGDEEAKPAKRQRKTPVKKKAATEGETTGDQEADTKPAAKGKKATATPRKSSATTAKTPVTPATPATAATPPGPVEVDADDNADADEIANVKKEMLAADAAEANAVLFCTKTITPVLPAAEGVPASITAADGTANKGEEIQVAPALLKTEAVVVPDTVTDTGA